MRMAKLYHETPALTGLPQLRHLYAVANPRENNLKRLAVALANDQHLGHLDEI